METTGDREGQIFTESNVKPTEIMFKLIQRRMLFLFE